MTCEGLRVAAVFTAFTLFFTIISFSAGPGFDQPQEPDIETKVVSSEEFDSKPDHDLPVTHAGRSARAENDETWVIDGIQLINDSIMEIHHNITVTAGSEFNLENSTLILKTGDVRIVITVEEGGRLTMNNSYISLDYVPLFPMYGYQVLVYGMLEMNRSGIIYSGYTNMPSEMFPPSVPEVAKWSFDGVVIIGGTGIINDSKLEANTNLVGINSTLTVKDSYFEENVAGLEIYNSLLTVDGTAFTNNVLSAALYATKNFTFTDSYFTDTGGIKNRTMLEDSVGFVISGSVGSIQGCSIKNMFIGISGYPQLDKLEKLGIYFPFEDIPYDHIYISNSSFIDNERGMEILTGIYYLSNMTFINNEDTADFQGFQASIYAQGSFLSADNVTIKNPGNGIFALNNGLVLTNSSISGAREGIIAESKNVFIDNSTIVDCGIGITISLWGDTGIISNSTISGNDVGINFFGVQLTLENNSIVDNKQWGVIVTSSNIIWKGENFPVPAGHPASEPTNGFGNLASLNSFKAHVFDQTNVSLGRIQVSLTHEKQQLLSKDYGINANTESITDMGGNANLGDLIVYAIITGVEKTYFNDYTLTATYKFAGDLEVSSSIDIDMEDLLLDWTDTFEIMLEIPNIYLDPDELELSRTSLKKGEALTVKAVVHYDGPSGVTMPEFNVTLKVSKKRIQPIVVSDLSSSNPEVALTFTWVAETDVPLANRIKERLVEVVLELPPNTEYALGSSRFQDDNNISANVNINIEKGDEGSGYFTGSEEEFIVLCGISIVIIILVIIAVVVIRRRKRKRSEDVKPPGEEEDKMEE